MKVLFICVLFTSFIHNNFAISSLPRLDLEKENKIRIARKNYKSHLLKCDSLLKSTSSESVVVKALKYVLHRRMPPPRIFDRLENASSHSSGQSRLEIAELITSQSLELQKLILLAESDQIGKYNTTSLLMMKQFDTIDNLLKQKISPLKPSLNR